MTNSWKTEYAYDGFGRRRVRKEFVWQSGQWLSANEVHYIYDGMLVIQERNVINVPMVTYTRGSDLSGTQEGAGGIGGLLARTDANGSAFYHADGNGNITAMVNGNGSLVAKYLYDSFGNLIAKSGSLADENTYRFSSKELDLRSGLYYYGFRFYDPNLQRWPNRDPIGEEGGINLYTYVGNDPVNWIDPLGLAYIADRPLQTSGGTYITPYIGKGYPAVHRQIFFEDYDKQKADPKNYPSNLGLFNDNKVRPDDASTDLQKKYERGASGFDDDLMRQAVENAKKKFGTNWKKTDNCQDFADKVTAEYFRLKQAANK